MYCQTPNQEVCENIIDVNKSTLGRVCNTHNNYSKNIIINFSTNLILLLHSWCPKSMQTQKFNINLVKYSNRVSLLSDASVVPYSYCTKYNACMYMYASIITTT